MLSLILSPLATELPEKYNAVVWIRQSKDNLALANITGAMVFQSVHPGGPGPGLYAVASDAPRSCWAGAIAIFSAALLYINVRDGELGTPTLMMGGVAYAVFIAGLRWLGALSERTCVASPSSRDCDMQRVRATIPFGNRDEPLSGDLPAVLRQPAALR